MLLQCLNESHLPELRSGGTAASARRLFEEQGFLLLPSALDETELNAARHHLTLLFQGEYDRGVPPTKPLKNPTKDFHFPHDDVAANNNGGQGDEDPPKPTSSSKRLTTTLTKKGTRTQQLINAWHADTFFQQLCTSPALGELVARVSGWEQRGCRLAQDQVWVKPPSAGSLTFHRDTTYFDMIPKEVTTVWFTFDDLDDELGPLEYCVGSHHWGESRRGSANQFFDPDYRRMLRDAAAREIAAFTSSSAVHPDEATTTTASDAVPASPPPPPLSPSRAVLAAMHLQIATTASLRAGGLSIHCGRLWHGSGPNASSTRYRRGMGIHFVPGDARLNLSDLGSLWKGYSVNGSDELPEEFFPWVFRPMGGEQEDRT